MGSCIGDFIQGATTFLENFIPKVISIAQWVWKWRGYIIPLIAAMWLLDAAMDANPVGLIVLGIEALAVGVALMVIHWKTVMPILRAVGETFMRWILTPVNLIIDGIKGLLWLLSQLPGKVGEPFKTALAAVQGFQDKMNTDLTGDTNQFGFKDIWANAKAPQTPATNVTVRNQVAIDLAHAPGFTGTVRTSPQLTGDQGAQATAGSAH